MLILRTFGTLTLQREDGEHLSPVVSQPKRLALLAFLAAAPEGDFYRRDTLLPLFWPEMDETHARNALSQSLSYLRRQLPPGVIVSQGPDEVGVARGAFRLDLHDFQSALSEGRWLEALNLYRGDFLRGFHLDGAPEFDEWMSLERDRLREAAAAAAWSLAGDQIHRGALVEAERTAQRALELVWTDETPVREFVQALARAGDRAAALNFYEKFCTRLREGLELEPSQATAQIAEAIRNGEVRREEAIPVPATDLSDAPQPPPGATEVPPNQPVGGERGNQPGGPGVPDVERGRPPGETAEDSVTSTPWKPERRSLARKAIPGGMAVILVALGFLVARHSERESGLSRPSQRQITFEGNVSLSSLSPNGEYVAYIVGASPGEIIVRDLANGAEITVADRVGSVFDLRWSPDGSRVGFAGEYQDRFGVYLFPHLGGTPQTAPRIGWHFAWSPDGRRLATWHRDPRSVLIQNLENGRVDSLLLTGQNGYLLSGGDWSPQGDILALTEGGEGGPSRIVLVDLTDGTDQILFSDSLQLRSPRWNSTGDALFFLRGGYRREGELWSIEVDTSRLRPKGPNRRIGDLPGVTRWTNSLGSSFDLSFDVSRGGRRLTYTTAFAHTNLSIIPPARDGRSGPVNLTTGTAQRRCPRLSPDGSSVAFLQETAEGWDLFRVSVDSGTSVRLTFSGAVVSDCASWDPESRRLALGLAVDGTRRLAVVPALGGAPRIYENTRMSMELAWAPSSQIAYQTPGNQNFRVFDPDTGLDKPLIQDPSERERMFDPRFSPDGTLLAVYWTRLGAPGVWVIGSMDGSRRQISSIRDFPIGWSGDGSALFTADPQRVVRRYPVDGGEAKVISQPPGVGEAQCQPHERATGLFWVCKAEVSYSDVWMVENFIGFEP